MEKAPNIVEIVLNRGQTGLGFLIAGGTDSPVSDTDTGIFVAKIIKDAAAHKDGKLAKGDKILQVNGLTMAGLSHKQAASRLIQAGERVVLRVDHGRGLTFLRQLSARKRQDGNRSDEKNGTSPTAGEEILLPSETNMCAPCAYEKKEQQANCYCVQCREYFCYSCRKHHQKFSFLRNHTLENRQLLKPGGVMSIVQRYQTLIS